MTGTNRTLVEQVFHGAPFIGSLEVKLISYGQGWCETTVDIVPALQQQHGFVHAGALMTLADHTCGGDSRDEIDLSSS
jgi:acyl-coenzyme A thioesterase PaaI-like protein